MLLTKVVEMIHCLIGQGLHRTSAHIRAHILITKNPGSTWKVQVQMATVAMIAKPKSVNTNLPE